MEAALLIPQPSWWGSDESWWCKTAPGSASGFKGVSQFGKKWRARGWVAGKGMRTVWVASTPEEAAWMLARWHHHPCELPSPKKGRAKPGEGKVRSRASLLLPYPTLTVGPTCSAMSGGELLVLSRR